MDYKPLTKCDAHPSRQFLICVSTFFAIFHGDLYAYVLFIYLFTGSF